MKRDEPKVYKVYTTMNEGAFGFCEGADPTDIELEHESVCLKSDVDKVITQLKEKLHDVDNKWNEQCKEIAELKAKLESVQASAYADSVDAGMRERRLRRALWKLKALYFYRLFQWSMEGARLAPEDDEQEDFFMECLGKHTKRKSEWVKEADMFDDARIVCIKKSEEYDV